MAHDGIRSYRPVIMGRRGAVASNHPLATQAGLLALQAGGDAVDAAVAIGATLGVVEPMMSGLGGDGFYHVYRKATGEAVVFNGTGAARRRHPGALRRRHPDLGPALLLDARHGRRLGRHARPLRPSLLAQPVRERHLLRPRGLRRHADYRHFAGEAADAPAPGRSQRPDVPARRQGPSPRHAPSSSRRLAQTLAEACRGGRGELLPWADRQAVRGRPRRGRRAGGGRGSGGVHPEEQAPISINYRGYTVTEAPPNSTGWVLLQELKIVEQFDLAAMGALSADTVHTLVEAKKLAFEDRERWGGDPRFFDAPLDELLSDAYAARRATLIDSGGPAPRAPSPAWRAAATRPITAWSMARATPSRRSRASTACSAPASRPATPASC